MARVMFSIVGNNGDRELVVNNLLHNSYGSGNHRQCSDA